MRKQRQDELWMKLIGGVFMFSQLSHLPKFIIQACGYARLS